ncbi:MAG: HAMP domain-containing histidine kinase [Oscillospiraceae bacterium]|nr:HAMP domain-containing histidine kinase [Oscillospiraceae bacterium]
MKFSWKVFFSTLILIAIVFSAGGTYLIDQVYYVAIMREAELAREENQMLRFSFLAAAGGVTGELTDSRARRLAQSIQDSGAYRFRLSKEQGGSLYATAGFDYPTDLADSLLTVDERSLHTRVWGLRQREGAYYVQTCCQVRAEQKSGGSRTFILESVRDLTYLFEQRSATITLFRWITAGVLAVSAVFMYVLAQYLTRPIRRLADVTRRFADGDYELRAPVTSRDEIGGLTQDFNAMAERLEQKILELEDARRRQEDFIASFAHELKTPLTAVIGYADLLRSQALTGEQRFRAANYIFNEGRRLESLSLKLLDLIVVRRQEFPMKRLDVAQLAEQAAGVLGPGFERDGVKLELALEPAVLPVEAGLLTSCIINLCDNARKASSSGGTVRVTGAWEGDVYLFQVQDEGIGMKPEELGRITEPFYMVDKSRSRAQNGAGLGLALCAAVAELHGTALEFQSEPGAGTTAKMRLSSFLERKEAKEL